MMAAFFILNIEIPDNSERSSYDEYIAKVKPIVESYGGKYIIRSENITAFAGTQKPDRIIVIRFDSRQQLDKCFASAEYAAVKGLRENSVKTGAFIVE
jgi:uncharacterized protein (DUF1330 family)